MTEPRAGENGPEPDPREPGTDAAVLFPQLYDQLRAIAAAALRNERADHTLQPTSLVHEAYARLADQTSVPWDGPGGFRAIAARVMRQVLVDHARRHNALKRGGDRARVTLTGLASDTAIGGIDVVELDDLLDRLRALHERKARVVELLFFGGLTHAEAGEVLGISPRTVESDWYMARAWLAREFSGRDT